MHRTPLGGLQARDTHLGLRAIKRKFRANRGNVYHHAVGSTLVWLCNSVTQTPSIAGQVSPSCHECDSLSHQMIREGLTVMGVDMGTVDFTKRTAAVCCTVLNTTCIVCPWGSALTTPSWTPSARSPRHRRPITKEPPLHFLHSNVSERCVGRHTKH